MIEQLPCWFHLSCAFFLDIFIVKGVRLRKSQSGKEEMKKRGKCLLWTAQLTIIIPLEESFYHTTVSEEKVHWNNTSVLAFNTRYKQDRELLSRILNF